MVYVARASSLNRVKIGFADDVDRRIRELQCGSPEPLEKVVVLPGGRAEEAALKLRFSPYRLHGEWFRCEGSLRRFLWDMDDQTADVPNPVPLADVWRAICRFDDRPVRLRRILTALADGDVELEEPVEPQRGDVNERYFHGLLRTFLSFVDDFDDDRTLSRLYQFTHDIDVLLHLALDGRITWDPALSQLVETFRKRFPEHV